MFASDASPTAPRLQADIIGETDILDGTSRRVARIVVFQCPEAILDTVGHERDIRHAADEIRPVVALNRHSGIIDLVYPVVLDAEAVAPAPNLHAVAETRRAELPPFDDAAAKPIDHTVAHSDIRAETRTADTMCARQRQMEILNRNITAFDPDAMSMLSDFNAPEAFTGIAGIAAEFKDVVMEKIAERQIGIELHGKVKRLVPFRQTHLREGTVKRPDNLRVVIEKNDSDIMEFFDAPPDIAFARRLPESGIGIIAL